MHIVENESDMKMSNNMPHNYMCMCMSAWMDICLCFVQHVPFPSHDSDVIMDVMASQITSLTIVYSIVYSGADPRKYQSSVSLTFVRGIHRWPINSLHKGPVTRKMFPFYDVIMWNGKRADIPCHAEVVSLFYFQFACWVPGTKFSQYLNLFESALIKLCFIWLLSRFFNLFFDW